MSLLHFKRLYFSLALISWIILLVNDVLIIQHPENNYPIIFSDIAMNVLLSTFFLFTFLGFKIQIGVQRTGQLTDMLWQVFLLGAVTIPITIIIKLAGDLLLQKQLSQDALLTNIFNHINLGLITIFIANSFYVWKKMILFQKSNRTDILWHLFEYAVLISILSNFFSFTISQQSFILATAPLTVTGIILTFNLKWVAFMNYKQKWRSILLLALLIVIIFTFLERIYEHHIISTLIIDLSDNIFILATMGFILANCFVALLVLLFNLPTSSVFEQKFGEVMLFQKLHQTLQLGDKEEDVYSILLESSKVTVMADAAWLEIRDERNSLKDFSSIQIDEFDVFEIKKTLRKNQINILSEPQYIKNIHDYPFADKLKHLSYKSLLMVPLTSNNQTLGTLVLAKNLADGFDKEMVDIIFTFVSQASIAIKNFRLMSEAIQTERYKEEIKIAKEVQKSLIPSDLNIHPLIQMNAFSKGAADVGGDYYDVFRISDEVCIVVIGDVSGHGTSAAFTMAQMKGIFHSLVHMNLSPEVFMSHANLALSKCLEKKIFITLSYFILYPKIQKIEYARAGHCPALLLHNSTGNLSVLDGKGLGLGLTRNQSYSSFIHKYELHYSTGDALILYTDGLVEAHNTSREEYGYDRLKRLIVEHSQASAKEMNDVIIEDVQLFMGTTQFEDDCTLLVLRFV
ncbi:MAG: SpoIIE family protein phosphatase [Cytophagaceae bacterium]|jgi:serine phosphatase RsbU (regulator of sigma subunit)|nr:SpoIIE family protein phosphatase [Cytophagaceae bacterium]